MNLAKKLTAFCLIIAMILCFAACSNDEAETALDIGTINMGFISKGDVEADPYSAFHYNLFKSAYESAGASEGQVTLEKDVKPNDTKLMDSAITDLVERGARLIVGIEPGYCKSLSEYAAKDDNKNIFFAVLGDYSDSVKSTENFAVINIAKYEAEYLEGIAAGKSTENGKIAYAADTTFGPLLNADVNAFAMGVQSIKPDAEIFLIKTEDVKKGVELSIKEGCDVIYSRNYVANEETGETFFTVPESVGSGMTLNKIDKDQKTEFISGISINADYVYSRIVQNTVNESFTKLSGYTWGIVDGVVDVFPAKDAEIKKAVDEAKQKFVKGENPIGKTAAELSKGYIKGIKNN